MQVRGFSKKPAYAGFDWLFYSQGKLCETAIVETAAVDVEAEIETSPENGDARSTGDECPQAEEGFFVLVAN